jgi:hypothetical protein
LIERRRYRRISVRIWGDDGFKRLSKPKPNAQTLLFRLMIPTEGLSLPGLIPVGEAALSESLGWPLLAFRKCFAELEREGMAKADWGARLIWLPNAVSHNPPENPNVIAGWRVAFDEAPECDLKTQAGAAIDAYLARPRLDDEKGLGEAFLKAWTTGKRPAYRKPLPKPLPNDSPKPLPTPSATNNNSNNNSNNKSVQTAPAIVPQPRARTLMAGTSPMDFHREHQGHAWCGPGGRLCVPSFIHSDLIRSYGKTRDEADRWLKARYGEWEAALGDAPIDDVPKFLRERYASAVRRAGSAQSTIAQWFQCRACGGAHLGKTGDPCPDKQAVIA